MQVFHAQGFVEVPGGEQLGQGEVENCEVASVIGDEYPRAYAVNHQVIAVVEPGKASGAEAAG